MVSVQDLPTRAIDRQKKVSDIADWYKASPSLGELKKLGMEVLVTVDHLHRIIRVERREAYQPGLSKRIPIEGRMEFDQSVLDYIKKQLENERHVVILDTSDVPGRMGHGPDATIGLGARITTMDIDSGDIVDETTITKSQPEFPSALRMKLLGVPRGMGDMNVVQRTFVAETFVSKYLDA
jgi:hypothetical protein